MGVERTVGFDYARNVRKFRTAAALVIAILWVAVGFHCMLEFVPGFAFLSCEASQSDAGSHCDDQACHSVEAGQFLLAARASLPQAPSFACVLKPLDVPPLLLPRPAVSAPVAASPPGLVSSWQFSLRAALPVRAPAVLS